MSFDEQSGELTRADHDLADQLARARPVPSAELRGVLGRHLAEQDPGYGPRPPHLRIVTLAYIGTGGLLMILGALQTTGAL